MKKQAIFNEQKTSVNGSYDSAERSCDTCIVLYEQVMNNAYTYSIYGQDSLKQTWLVMLGYISTLF